MLLRNYLDPATKISLNPSITFSVLTKSENKDFRDMPVVLASFLDQSLSQLPRIEDVRYLLRHIIPDGCSQPVIRKNMTGQPDVYTMSKCREDRR